MRGISKKDTLACQVSLGLFAGLLGIASTAHGMPVHDGGGDNHDGVRAGGATIAQAGTTMNITSGNANNVIGWKDFSVKNGETVQFDNGAQTNNYLNVVTGKVTSRIDGAVTGGNNVYIANTNGVIFGSTASVNVGNLYVTTRDVNVDTIGTAVAGGATLAAQEGAIINTTAAAAPETAKAEIVSLVDGTGHSVNANKIVLEGQSVRILNSDAVKATNTEATGGVQISVSADTKNFGNTGTEAKRAKGYIHVGGAAPANYHGNLDVESFQLVSTPQELEDMKNDLAGKYMLKNDIDLSSTTHTAVGTNAAPFTGKFDGMFHEVKNMNPGAGTATDYAGLFGNVSGATIMNVGIKDANLSALNYGGAVVGKAENNSHIFNVYNESASMIGSTSSNATNAGGIVGWLDNSTLDTAYNTSNVGNKAGGLVGNLNYAQIMDAYNEGGVQVNASEQNVSWGVYGSGNGTSTIVRNVYLKNGGNRIAGGNDNSLSVQASYQIKGIDGKKSLLKDTGDPTDALSATSYSSWDIAADGGENKTWRIFDGHSLPLLTAFMQGAVQAEYAYADFQQPGVNPTTDPQTHSGDTASTYTVQAKDKKTDGSYVTRAGSESNGGKSVSRVYNADYLKIAKKNGDGSYSAITDVTDADLKLYGADDRSLVQLSQGTAGGGRRNAGANADYKYEDTTSGKGGREAMLYGGQHGYDIAGANVTIGKRKVIGSVNNMGPIEREYDGTADASAQFVAAIKTGDISLRTDGLVDGDGASVRFTANNAVTFRDGWTAGSLQSPDAGYGKAVFVDGTLVQFDGVGDNYDYDASAINALNLKGNITQRTIYAKLNPSENINKVYDGNVNVKDDSMPKSSNNILTIDTATKSLGDGDTTTEIDYVDIRGKYMTGDRTNPGTETKQAGAHGVAYSGVKLKGEKAKNYKLVDLNDRNNVLYREAVTGEPTATAGDAVASGTIWGKGTIAKRKIDPTKFTVTNGANRVYDGTDYLIVDGVSKKIEGPAEDGDKNIIAADKDKISFAIALSDNKAYYVQNDGTTHTKNVYVSDTDGAKYLLYSLKASNAGTEDILSNYQFDIGNGVDLVQDGIYNVTGEGRITPRTVYVDLLQKTGIDKTYDGDATVKGDYYRFGTGKNYGYTANAAVENKLVGDADTGVGSDGARITAAAVYKTKNGHTEQDKDVYHTGNVLTGAVEDNGKDVEYTIALDGDHAQTNYLLSYTPTGGAAVTGSSVQMTATGKITPKELTATATSPVTRSYNGGSDAAASLLAGHYTLAGKVNTDAVDLDTAGSTITGKYYNAAGTQLVSNAGTGYTVKYTGFATGLTGADSGNYTIADAFDIQGNITKAILNPNSFHMVLTDTDRVTKTYDANDNALSGGLQKITIDGTALAQDIGYSFDQEDSKYYSTAANTGNTFKVPNANVQEDGTTLHTGANPYGVRYSITLLGDTAGNYDLSGLNGQTGDGGTYTVTGNKVTFARDGIGYIKSRRIYVSLGGAAKGTPTKEYDGTNRLIIQGNSTGSVLVTFGNGGGADAADAGIASYGGSPAGINQSTGAYESYKAGDPTNNSSRNVHYTPVIVNAPKTNYVFYHSPQQQPDAPVNPYLGQKWDPVNAPLVGNGKITQKDLLVTAPTDVRRQYNGDTDVLTTQGKLTLATPLKHESAPGQNDANTTAGVIDDVALNEIDETKDGTGAGVADKYYRYYNGADANASDAQSQTDYVTYRRIQLTGTDAGNYRLVYATAGGQKPLDKDADYADYYTMTGRGVIERRQVNPTDFHLDFAGVTKVYDGTSVVKYNQDSTRAGEYITKVAVNLGGTIGERNLNYTLDKAVYADPNVSANAGTGNVTYTLKLNGDLLKNYDFTNLNNAAAQNAGYSYDSASNAVTRTLGVGTITKRAVYAHVVDNNLTKTYNAKKNVVDESGARLTGSQLVKFDNVRNGVAQADAGLLDADDGKNATTALYTDKNVGDGNKTVDYTLLFSNDAATNAALSGNYELRNDNDVATTTLQTTTNTINRRALRLKADEVTKVYDANTTVKVNGAASTTGAGLSWLDENQDRQKDENDAADVFSLGTSYTREYNSPNATRTEAAKKNNVTYRGITFSGTDAGNYYLADSDGKALVLDATTPVAGDYTMTGDGAITPLNITRDRFKLTFQTTPIQKTYDGTANVGVGDATYNQPANLEGYIREAYVTDTDGVTKLFDIGVEKVNSATYRTGVTAGSDGTADKNAADGKKVLFNLKFSDADRNNFDFDSSFYTGSAGSDRMVHDAAANIDTYNVYTTGDIKKKNLRVDADDYARKVYDGTANVGDIDKHLKLRDADIVTVDGNMDRVSLTGSSGVFKQGGNDVSDANIAPTDANARGYDVVYTVQMSGADSGNYNFIRSDNNAALAAGDTINAKGDIEKRKIYALVVNDAERSGSGPLTKMYDGTGTVDSKGEALVRFGNKLADGTEIENSGYLGAASDNATTAVYEASTGYDVGDNKDVTYTLAFDPSAQGSSNYVFYDARTGRPAATLLTKKNVINPAVLNFITTGDPEKFYDGNANVLQRYLKLVTTNGTDAGIQLNYTATYDNKNASRVKPDGTLEKKKVSYSGITLGMGNQSAKNYTIRYGGVELEAQNGVYNIEGQGIIKKRLIANDADLHINFAGDKIQKTYDGTTNLPANVGELKNYVTGPLQVSYADNNGSQSVNMDSDLVTVVDAAYADKNVKRDASGNVLGDKDVNFRFTLDGDNFDLSGLDQTKLQRGEESIDSDGYRHYTYTYTRANQNGQIDPRKVNVEVGRVGKIYDGTVNIRATYYDSTTGEAKTDADFDIRNVVKLASKNGDSGLLDGVALDYSKLDGQYIDSDETVPTNDARNANRDPNKNLLANHGDKKVAYTIHLTGDDENNYEFVGTDGNSVMKENPLDGNKKTRVIGAGDIYQRKLSTSIANTDKTYDAAVDADTSYESNGVKHSNVTFGNQIGGDGFQLDETANNLLTAQYGDYDSEKKTFTSSADVKRNENGGVIARDVEYRGLQNALNDLKQRDARAQNYFVEDTVYGKGQINPQRVTAVKEIWRGASFEKVYDGETTAFMPTNETDSNIKTFKDKLQLQLELAKKDGTKETVTLDYDMYEDGKKAPQYDTKNVLRDDGSAGDKDIIYTLRGRKSLTNLMKDGAVNYEYEAAELNDYFMDGKKVHLKDDANPTPTVKARITPKKVAVAAPYISKIYDATADIPAGTVAGWTQTDLVADEETRTMMAKDKVTVDIDATNSKFLDGNNAESAIASADPEERLNGKKVKYQIQLASTAANPEIEKANYEFSTGNTIEGQGDILRRMVHVVADDTKKPIDKIYDGDDYVRNADGTVFKRKFKLEEAISGDTGIIASDAGSVNLEYAEVAGHFASPTDSKYGSEEVERDKSGNIINKDVVYKEFTLNGTAGNNYIVAEAKDGYKDPKQAKITPREIDLSLTNPNVTKEYDGTKEVKDNADGKFLTDNIQTADSNPVYNPLTLPTLNRESAEYTNENAGTGKRVEYKLNWTNGNYTFKGANVTASTLPDENGVYRVTIATDTGTITKRKVDVTAANARKTYDATRNVNDAWNNLKGGMKHHDGNGPAWVNEKDEKALEEALTGRYNNENAGDKDVTYTFDSAAAVMNNYEFANENAAAPVVYGNVVTGKGTIDRRHLQVVSDSPFVMAGSNAASFTGRIRDGVNPGAATTPEIIDEINGLNDGTFSYGPAGDVDYRLPGSAEIHGWYMKDGSRTLAAGNYGENFILDEVPGTLSVAPLGDDGVDRRFRPDDMAYIYASYDDADTLAAQHEADAAIAYRDRGVNIGDVFAPKANDARVSGGSASRPAEQSSAAAQQGTGIRQQGTAARQQGAGSAQSGARAGGAYKADGSYGAASQGLANALGGNMGYYNGRGYNAANDDEEQEIRRKAQASA